MRSGHHPRLTGCRGCNPDAGLAVGFAGRITGFPATEWSVTRKPAAPAEKGPPRRFTPPGALARDHERMAGFLARGSPPYAPPSQAIEPSGITALGSPLTVAGAAAAWAYQCRTAFPFDPRREPSTTQTKGRHGRGQRPDRSWSATNAGRGCKPKRRRGIATRAGRDRIAQIPRLRQERRPLRPVAADGTRRGGAARIDLRDRRRLAYRAGAPGRAG